VSALLAVDSMLRSISPMEVDVWSTEAASDSAPPATRPICAAISSMEVEVCSVAAT
jgi:hypothetical protein